MWSIAFLGRNSPLIVIKPTIKNVLKVHSNFIEKELCYTHFFTVDCFLGEISRQYLLFLTFMSNLEYQISKSLSPEKPFVDNRLLNWINEVPSLQNYW